jgi:hypothetical protein
MLKRVITINKSIGRLNAELQTIQATCSHPPATVRYKYDANTGNWDHSDDSYWTNIYCGTCGKYWTENGSTRFPPEATQVRKGESVSA